MSSFVQTSFLGGSVPADRGRGTVSVKERLRADLRRKPTARNSYKAAMVEYWLAYEGLADALTGNTDPVEAFRDWFCSQGVTSPKTLQNRAMEVQRENPDLDASGAVRAWRDKQGRNGPVGI